MRTVGSGVLCLALLGVTGCRRQPIVAARPPVAPSYPPSKTIGGGAGKESRQGPEVVRIPAEGAKIPVDARLLATEEGLASWYGTVYDGRRGADGTVYDQNAMTAASRTLPLGVMARVTNLADGQVAIVRITDRGPFVPGRILDLSRAAARALGLDRMGVGKVRVEAYAGEGFRESPARWCVQIGAFVDPDDARQLRNDLQRRYQTAKVIAFDGPTGSWVRLTLASAEDKVGSTAIATALRVPDPGVEAYVTRTN